MRVLRALWARWQVIAHKIGNFQARVLLSVFYFVVLGPFALVARMFSDPLHLKERPETGWLPRALADNEPLVLARRQF